MTILRVSEHFYSIQGEGPTVGVPAVFLRLQGCNLNCGASGGVWACDTEAVWKRGDKHPIDSFFQAFTGEYGHAFECGAHLIITGGEPLLQQSALIEWLSMFQTKPLIEVETNGTITPTDALDALVDQWNVSPKLSNSGEGHDQRLVPDALTWFEKRAYSIFKYVIKTESDINEIYDEFPWLKQLPIRRKYLMPAADNKDTLESLYPHVITLSKTRGFSLGQRFHISMWDQTTGI